MNRAIWWIRRDLRLVDNQALSSALEQAEQVLPVFVLDPKLLASPYAGEKRVAFMLAALRSLDASLRERGNYLIVRQGYPLDELSRVIQESQAQAIFAESDISPYAQKRDSLVERSLPLHWVGGPSVYPPGAILKANGEPYTVFTPFSKAWQSLPAGLPDSNFRMPTHIPTPPGFYTLPLPDPPDVSDSIPFEASEAEAQRRLASFMGIGSADSDPEGAKVWRYAYGRNRLDLEATSQLSPYLRLGMLSTRQAVAAARQAIWAAPGAEARQSAETWLNELIWREFYIYILYHFPHVRQRNFRLPGVRWQNDPAAFAAWCEGRTGYPVVDAAMRQLSETGWMHNRARMIVASFLTKDLLVDWRWGERWFMQHLIDGDPASNNGGWQWAAGTGTDAAPYFRIFNPISQGLRHDPQGFYIRRWLPELANVPGEYIHEPWKMPAEVQEAVGCQMGRHYPFPIVDHAQARERALLAYRS